MLRSNFSFTIFSLMFLPLFSKVFTDILNIYEVPKIYDKKLKLYKALVLKIFIYHANYVSQVQLAFELYPYQIY